MAGRINFYKPIIKKLPNAKGVKKGAFIWVYPNVSDVLTPFAIENSLFSWTTADYFFFVSSDLPVLLEMDSLISESAWIFWNL